MFFYFKRHLCSEKHSLSAGVELNLYLLTASNTSLDTTNVKAIQKQFINAHKREQFGSKNKFSETEYASGSYLAYFYASLKTTVAKAFTLLRLSVNLWIFLFSEREGKHNSFSVVDLPGKTSVYILNIKVVMCLRHAEKNCIRCEAASNDVCQLGDWHIDSRRLHGSNFHLPLKSTFILLLSNGWIRTCLGTRQTTMAPKLFTWVRGRSGLQMLFCTTGEAECYIMNKDLFQNRHEMLGIVMPTFQTFC